MNVENLIADLNEIENELKDENKGEEEEFVPFNFDECEEFKGKALYDENLSYYSIFNIKKEYKKMAIKVEKIQVNVINNLIFFFKLNKVKSNPEMVETIKDCLNFSFQNNNDETIKKSSEEKSLFAYKQHLLKNKYFFLKILRRIKNRSIYPDIKQIIKDVTRDVFSFNGNIYNGSIGFEGILLLLYKLLNKHFKCPLRNFLLSFFLLSIMSRTNNSVDILYILEYFYKNNNFSHIIPNSSFLSPCEVTVYNNIIILKSNIKYFINITEDYTNLSYNCHNIIYIDEELIADNFYLDIYKELLKQDRYHYLFGSGNLFEGNYQYGNKHFVNLNFFDVDSVCRSLKRSDSTSIYNNLNVQKQEGGESVEEKIQQDKDEQELKKDRCYNANSIDVQEENSSTNKKKMNRSEKKISVSSSILEDIGVSSNSTYDYNDNEIDIKKINEQNSVYQHNSNDINKSIKNFFYQYLIIELTE
ncbi:hypothetical protein MKS88_001963 [Plasmodium brasilianum]|uniref:Uncharacterized protein n=2 Tax=Plasmodium (Plasmodium) TaxID=418103 RepID=A0A1A8X1Z6_PLAMA|nr:conserved Plasmodium protein, unknown function [Plasmodium malariae]KAI4839413.1 hypothetical protein MKS88_001963 [Plasmodium brasilianum]SBS98611.1 hypothetical protein PMALA_064090 [Plasmodium malariae]SBT87832.1 conserved Plasmodium protein, unknown function [Plasmodium malariae]